MKQAQRIALLEKFKLVIRNEITVIVWFSKCNLALMYLVQKAVPLHSEPRDVVIWSVAVLPSFIVASNIPFCSQFTFWFCHVLAVEAILSIDTDCIVLLRRQRMPLREKSSPSLHPLLKMTDFFFFFPRKEHWLGDCHCVWNLLL